MVFEDVWLAELRESVENEMEFNVQLSCKF